MDSVGVLRRRPSPTGRDVRGWSGTGAERPVRRSCLSPRTSDGRLPRLQVPPSSPPQPPPPRRWLETHVGTLSPVLVVVGLGLIFSVVVVTGPPSVTGSVETPGGPSVRRTISEVCTVEFTLSLLTMGSTSTLLTPSCVGCPRSGSTKYPVPLKVLLKVPDLNVTVLK